MTRDMSDDHYHDSTSVQDAVKDLMMLEQVHVEADHMKALGNQHMARKEYELALECYSKALKLSPVGPNSHVFLSNRSAALLSLKKFRQAAVDAKRAIHLQSTFGKAHARLGQALYYQKDYAGALRAYENAVNLDPDNAVSLTYLKKARAKLEKLQITEGNKQRAGDNIDYDAQTVGSFRTTNSVLSHWYPPGSEEREVEEQQMLQQQQRRSSPQSTTQKNGSSPKLSMNKSITNEDESERLHRRGNKRFARKEFQLAIEEYSAAIWLCPDDPEYSPKYYVSRASAYFHTHEFMLAKEDCEKSLHLFPDEPQVYILLGKSLYELEAFHECIDVMEYGFELLEETGASPSSFDEVYLTKAKAAVNIPAPSNTNPQSGKQARRAIPKLPPPRFVSREEAIQTTGRVPALPSNWPVQALGETTLKLGPERVVIFGDGPMGVKLNRGPDGVVRVLSTSQSYERHILEGEISVGDVVREMANVDLRRPLTNIMWGDTVALIRMSPRPITLVVAKELSEPPKRTALEITKAATDDLEHQAINYHPNKTKSPTNKRGVSGGGAYQRRLAERQAKISSYPSRSSSEEPVAMQAIIMDNVLHPDDSLSIPDTIDLDDVREVLAHDDKGDTYPARETGIECLDTTQNENTEKKDGKIDHSYETSENENTDVEEVLASSVESSKFENNRQDSQQLEEGTNAPVNETNEDEEQQGIPMEQLSLTKSVGDGEPTINVKIDKDQEIADAFSGLAEQKVREAHNSIEIEQLGGKVVFGDYIHPVWNDQTWDLAASGRSILFAGKVCSLSAQSGIMLTRVVSNSRTIAIFSNPDLILLLRDPDGNDLRRYHREIDTPLRVVEAVIDAQTLKLRLSNTTTPTSVTDLQLFQPGKLQTVLNRDESFDRRACIELVTPQKTYVLSIPDAKKRNKSDVFLSLSAIEVCITQLLCTVHGKEEGGLTQESYLQVVLGTLHSHVVVGNETELEYALKAISGRERDLIDLYDEDGKTALHYACAKRSTDAVKLLVASSADVTLPTKVGAHTPCHLSAEMLDDMSISILQSSKFKRPDPSAINENGETPMFVACVRGRSVGTVRDPYALGRCLLILKSWGGDFFHAQNECLKEHPVSIVAREWRAPELSVILSHCELVGDSKESLGGRFGYPLHTAILSLHKFISGDSLLDIETHDKKLMYTGFKKTESNAVLIYGGDEDEQPFPRTLRVLLEAGFEPNERVEFGVNVLSELDDISGFTPIQLLAAIVMDTQRVRELDSYLVEIIQRSVRVLLAAGSRLDLAPAANRARPRKVPLKAKGSSPNALREAIVNQKGIYERGMSLLENENLIDCFGGIASIVESQSYWSSMKTICWKPDYDKLTMEDTGEVPNSTESGGNDEKSCAICWQEFGMFSNRSKICHYSQKRVCSECSEKTITIDGCQYRVSDGQFNAISTNAAKQEISRRKIYELKRQQAQEERKALEAQAKEGLFGTNIGSNANQTTTAQDVTVKTHGLSAELNQTRNALLERGEKLQSVSDKSESLRNQSLEFANLAKQLEKQSRNGFFGF